MDWHRIDILIEVDCLGKHKRHCAELYLLEITVHLSIAEFTAQTLSLSYLNGDFVR